MIHICRTITGILRRQRKSGSGIKSAKQVLTPLFEGLINHKLIIASLSVLVLLIFVQPAHAVVVGCPTCMHQTIKSALNDPATRDQVIQLHPAASPYMEGNLNVIQGRTLESTTPNVKGSVTIDGTGRAGPVLTVGPGTYSGLTITGGNNATGPGGGIRFNGSVVLMNMIIEGNFASSGGAVGTMTGSTQLTIENCTIRNNSAAGTGGGVLGGVGGTNIIGSEITGNIAAGTAPTGRGNGGGVALRSLSTNSITNSIISNNHANGTTKGEGGGLFLSNANLIMTNVTLQGNTAASGNSLGNGGGVYISSGRGITNINGGVISGNSAGKGGGVFASASGAGAVNIATSITGNSATLPVGNGGGVYCSIGLTRIHLNGVFTGNTPDDVAGCGDGTTPPVGTTRTRADNDNSASSNDPVNMFTGELYNQYDPDITLGGPMPLLFARYYASGFRLAGIHADMGRNWRHRFDWKLSMIGTSINIVNHQGRTIQFTWNGASWDLVGKADIVYQLTENTGIFTLLDPRNQQSYTFNGIGQLTSIADGRGNVHTLTYASGLLTQVSDGLGRVLNFTYDASNHLISSVDDGQGRTVGFAYTNINGGYDLTSVTDLNGHITTYNYNTGADKGLLLSMLRPGGNTPFQHSWYYSKKASSETDANGNRTDFTYVNATTTTVTDPLGNVRTLIHTASGVLADSQDKAGQSIAIGSDATGRRNSITDRLGSVTTMSYHTPSGKLASRSNADGSTTNFTYTGRVTGSNTAYDLTGITHADGATENMAFDAAGNLTSHIDQAGNSESFTYNANGQPLVITNKLSGMTTNTYSADATAATTTDPAGNVTTFAYDALKRPNLITHADTTSQSVTYDAGNRPLTATNENGNTVTMTYDTNGNLATVTDPLTNSASFAYDGNDRLLTVTDALGGVSSRSYDQLGRVATTTDANASAVTRGYDIHNRLTSVTDPMSNVWSSSYDAEGIISSTTDPLFNATTFTSDTMGRITGITSPLGNTSSVTYDAMGRVITSTDALSHITSFTRDSRGLVTVISLPGGAITTAYARNSAGQKTSITDPNSNVWQRGFDSSGRMTTYSDPLSRSQVLTYDNRNRLSTVTYPGGIGSVTMSYDAAGNLTGHAFSDGTNTSYAYDANNRLTTATGITRSYDANGRISNSNGIAITRDVGGRITTMTLAAGKAVTYAYDANDRVTSVTDWIGGVTSFTYDAAGRLTGITRPNAANGTYGYDNDSRLTAISEGSYSIALTRDAKGQITDATRVLPQSGSSLRMSSSANTFDAASQISGASYDAVGRITGNGADSFTWNLASLLTAYSAGGVTATATYDAQGRRLSRTVAASTRNYIWNDALGLGSISVEKQGATDLKYYIHSPGGTLLYSIDAASNARSFYHYDEMGNTSFISDDAGAVIGSYAYSPFGQITASTGGLDNPFTWQGQYGIMDEGNGLYYIRARYYDSRVGRFINRDPVKQTGVKSVNPYQYALNNPLRFVDVSGLGPNDVIKKKLFEQFGIKKKPAFTMKEREELRIALLKWVDGVGFGKALPARDGSAFTLPRILSLRDDRFVTVNPPGISFDDEPSVGTNGATIEFLPETKREAKEPSIPQPGSNEKNATKAGLSASYQKKLLELFIFFNQLLVPNEFLKLSPSLKLDADQNPVDPSESIVPELTPIVTIA